jgi:putative two-component system response regulator
VLIVDDAPELLASMNELLKDDYRTKVATNGEQALKIAATHPLPDLILLDVVMPGMDGYEVCRRLKADPATAAIPVIFLTVRSEIEDEREGFAAGCVDYITKPVSPPILEARVKTQLALKTTQDFLRDQNAFLEAEVERRTRELRMIQDVTIMAMASLAETRDNETGNHIRRTQNYVAALARRLQARGSYPGELTDDAIELIRKSAPLHDIGKVGIPDSILLKPGRLTPEEWEIMKTHTTLGRDAILAAEKLISVPSSFLRYAREIAHYHHEKWDGSGYPEGLGGERIPISARLMAVADVYDAFISRRVYKPAYTHEMAVEYIRESRGRHFDPDMVDAFLAIQEDFRAIAQRFADIESDPKARAAAQRQ